MRVAISGTHCCGKSTLIEAFLRDHRDYLFEPEPYEALADLCGETFAADPTADDFFRQLEYQVARLGEYQTGDRVVFERSPVDYVAYLLALGDLGREGASVGLTQRSIEVARDGVGQLDVIVYLPIDGGDAKVGDSEDPELRRAVDERLARILVDDDLDLFTAERPTVIEAPGTTARRLRFVETALR
jgi:hypothetical protein